MPLCSFLSSIGVVRHHHLGRDKKSHQSTARTLGSLHPPAENQASWRDIRTAHCSSPRDRAACDAKLSLRILVLTQAAGAW